MTIHSHPLQMFEPFYTSFWYFHVVSIQLTDLVYSSGLTSSLKE